MKKTLASFLLFLPCIPLPALGEDAAPSRVTCVSVGNHWHHCHVEEPRAWELVRQLSRAACLRNHSWGRDDHGIWVSRGCRAEFARVRAVEAAERERAPQRLRCESRMGAEAECPIDTRGGVRLLQPLSGTPCELGKSWGFSATAIWVSRGCAAEFEIAGGGAAAPRRWWQRLRRGSRSAGQALRCDSQNGQRRECRFQPGLVVAQVDMVQQLSQAPCREGQSWGWDAGQVWVEAGCRAEFMLWQEKAE